MTAVGRADTQRHTGLIPLVIAALSVAAVTAWLVVRSGGSVAPGYLAGPVAMACAAFSCFRIGSLVMVPRPVRGFWRRLSHMAVCVGLGSCMSLALANNDPGMSPFVAVPMLLGVAFWALAFLHLRPGRRSMLRWAQVGLDTATVGVAAALVFWYVVLDFAPAEIPFETRAGAATVGVGGVLSMVLIGKAAVSTESPVDAGALRILTVAPLAAVAATVTLIVAGDAGRLVLSVLAVPVIATATCAAAHRQRRALTSDNAAGKDRGRRRGVVDLVPFLGVVTTAGLVVFVSARELTWHQRSVIIGAVLIAAFVVTRQLLGLRENSRLLDGIRQQQAELHHHSSHDPLTGLANRARFATTLSARLSAHQPTGVLLIDIDDFKTVNDTMGHAVGDQLLYAIAERLRAHSRTGDLPARLGSDEFAVLHDSDTPADAENTAVRILAALAEPFHVGEHHLLAHASIGIALAGPGDTADELLRNADIAMHSAKDSGKASWTRFEPRMRHDVINHARLGSELHNAIIRHELFLHYQPVYDLVTGELTGGEALVRWLHPQRGPIAPNDFIPFAERSGLIVPLGAWVLRQACEQLAAWHEQYPGTAIQTINVNVAARQLREAGFIDVVTGVLAETGLRPGNLTLEITETAVLDDRHIRDTLHTLHDLGIHLALDDFGTGQSSLSLLRAFPVDILKLDKSFVDGICDDDDHGRLAIAAAVAQLAEHLHLKTVAEGIETPAELTRLRHLGYRHGQGFHLARPLPAAEFGALMTGAHLVVPVG